MAAPAQAGDGEWLVRFEPVFMEAYGHDQHVLTVHRFDYDPTPMTNDRSAVSLDTDGGLAYRARFQYSRGRWNWGAEGLVFLTSQDTPVRTAAAGGGVDEVVYEVADRSFVSSAPDETLYYRVLEDTDLQMWTVDLFAERVLVNMQEGACRVLFGLRLGDFDNDYRAVAGIEGVEGRRFDASSNYDLMMGPVLGMSAEFRRGRQTIRGTFNQSLLLGEAELTGMSGDFTGPFSEMVPFTSRERVATMRDVAIPVTELRIRWAYGLTGHLTLGAGIETAVWWDVSVPPGVIPVEDGNDALHENTIVLYGMSVSAEYRF
jgi:hypothetical protein